MDRKNPRKTKLTKKDLNKKRNKLVSGEDTKHTGKKQRKKQLKYRREIKQ